MMFHLKSTFLLALLGVASSTSACTIPTGTLSNSIPEKFQIVVQNPSLPVVHNRIMNFRPNGLDKHLVLRPMGEPTYDLIYLENGLFMYEGRHAVIDLEYNPNDNTTKMFLTDRTYSTAIFQPVYGCDPDTDALQIRLKLVSRGTTPIELDGQIGIQTAGDTYEFRYSPANNSLLVATWLPVNMVIFRDGIPPPPSSTTSTAVASPTASTTINDYSFVGCWAEPDAGRTLPTVSTAADMTNEKCAIACAGSAFMGTQFGVECWCGPSLAAGSAAAPAADCSNVCGGAATEICGGPRRLSLYQLKSASASTSSSNPTSSSASSSSKPASSSSSSSSSSSPSSSKPSTTSSSSSSNPSTSSSSSSSSSKPSTSSSSSSAKPSTTSSLPTSSSTSIGSTLSTSTVPTNPTALPAVGKYNFVSCYAEPPTGRALTGAMYSGDDMTLEKCAGLCTVFPYFGTEWNRECWCGQTLTAGSAPAPLSDCSAACTGNAAQMCGGSQRLSLYHNDAYVTPEVPSIIGGYKLYGCVTDSPARSLTGASLASSTMTLEMCATFCNGFTYFGTEWSVECYCGNSFATTAALVDISQCSMSCGGNSAELCGNGDRLTVYQLA